MSDKPLHVQVAEALGTKPDVRFAFMNRDETGIFIDFDRKANADNYVADHFARYPTGLYAREGAHVVERHYFPRYDTDWSATGPLIERYGINLGHDGERHVAGPRHWPDYGHGPEGYGPTPLIAVCNLILALHAAGKLPKP